MTTFLCGCRPAEKRHYSGNVIELAGGLQTYSDKRTDKEGFEVCPEHGERLSGWASPSTTGPQGNEILDYGKLGSNGTLKNLNFDGEDRRDNRDPQEVYEERRREKAQMTNGH